MVMGSPFLCRLLKVPKVTFLRWLAGAAPMGEWELYRSWVAGIAHGGVVDEVG